MFYRIGRKTLRNTLWDARIWLPAENQVGDVANIPKFVIFVT